jgi:hypothetical protein
MFFAQGAANRSNTGPTHRGQVLAGGAECGLYVARGPDRQGSETGGSEVAHDAVTASSSSAVAAATSRRR